MEIIKRLSWLVVVALLGYLGQVRFENHFEDFAILQSLACDELIDRTTRLNHIGGPFVWCMGLREGAVS